MLKLKSFAVASLLFSSLLAQAATDIECNPEKPLVESSFARSLEVGKFILPAKKAWWNWGMAPIYDAAGKQFCYYLGPRFIENSIGYK